MKKVIGVALAASLVAGMAFADVAVTLNARVRSNMYHQKKLDSGDKTTTTFDLDGAAAHGGSGTMSDVLGFKASTDYAGVVLDIAANRKASDYALTTGSETVWYNETSGKVYTSKTAANESDNKAKSVTLLKSASLAGGQPFTFDGAYYGFMKFSGLQFTFGTFDSRHVARYNTSAGEDGLLTAGDYKNYGLAALAGSTRMKDAANVSAIAGAKSVGILADYTFDDVAGGKVLVKGGIFDSAYKTDEDDATSKKYQKAGYVGEVDFDSDMIILSATVKVPTEKSTVFAVTAEPKLMKELPLAFGFSYGKDSEDSNKFTGYAFDARVGYIINDQAKISTLAKYESVSPDGGDTDTALTVAGEASYIVNDLATAFVGVRYINADFDKGGNVKDNCQIQFRPGVVLNAGAGARVTAAFQYDNYTKTTKDTGTKTEWSIPVIFRVQL